MEFIRDLNSVPFNPEGFGALFESGIADGLFDQVEYNTDGSYPTFILHKDGVAICDIIGVTSSASIYICPVFDPSKPLDSSITTNQRYKIGSGYSVSGYISTPISRSSSVDNPCLMRCSGGYIIYNRFPDPTQGATNQQSIIIGKTSSNKTGFCVNAMANVSSPFQQNNDTGYVTVSGDSRTVPSVYRFTKTRVSSNYDPYYEYGSSTNYLDIDRVILTQIPVPGQYGSNDYFTTAFFRAMDSFSGNGEHVINGKKYGVLGNWAILDE